ncbi:MAG: hypothetical protein F6K55_03770 [Moorea sp. SIO4A3]|nr:hypothetical protein [Moorena sp. SIO4A3]
MEWHNSKSILTDWCVDWWDGSLAKETPEEDVQSFRAMLTQNLYRSIEKKKEKIILDCDYEPSGLLEQSADEALLDYRYLPKKTMMKLTADSSCFGGYEVNAKYGYRGKWQVLNKGRWQDLRPKLKKQTQVTFIKVLENNSLFIKGNKDDCGFVIVCDSSVFDKNRGFFSFELQGYQLDELETVTENIHPCATPIATGHVDIEVTGNQYEIDVTIRHDYDALLTPLDLSRSQIPLEGLLMSVVSVFLAAGVDGSLWFEYSDQNLQKYLDYNGLYLPPPLPH